MARATGREARSRRDATRLCVGQFGAPHGVRGEIRLRSFMADPAALASLSGLTSEDGAAIAVSALRKAGAAPDLFIARVDGVTDRDAAARLVNRRLFVRRDALPPPEDDEFYLVDLIGLAVEDLAGAPLGRVVAVPDFGAGDLLEIVPADGGPTWFLPFRKVFAPIVDIAGGRVVVVPPIDGERDEPGRDDDGPPDAAA